MSDTEDITQALSGEVIIAGWKIPVLGAVSEPNLARFAPKVTTGDFSVDNEDLLSTWILNDFSGGGQIEKIAEGADEGRFYVATVDSTKPHQTTLAPLARNVVGPNSNTAYPMGDLNNTFYSSWGTAIRAVGGGTVTGSTATTSGATSLTATPVGPGVAFKGTGTLKLYVPQGTNGYDAFTGAAVAHGTTPKAQSFAVWDNKLFALATDGGLYQSSDGASWTLLITLDAAFAPRHLIAFFNRQGEETLHLVTDSATFAYDAETNRLVMTFLRMPPHPYNGLGTAIFDNRLHVSAGGGVTLYDGSIQGPMGQNRDDGQPYRFRGPVRSLATEHNGMYALTTGATSVVSAEETFEPSDGPFDDEPVFAASSSVASLDKFTGRGWHKLWASDVTVTNTSWLVVSAASSTYRVFWGADANLFYHDLDPFFANPKQIAIAGTGAFAPSGYLETGDFDAGMEGFWKLGSSVKVKLDVASATESVGVNYSTDGGLSWVGMGTVNATTETRYFFGLDRVGLPFKRIRLRFDYARAPTDVTKTPVFAYAVMSYRKIGRVSLAWDFRVPLTHPNGYAGRGNDEIVAHLYGLAGKVVDETISSDDPAKVPLYFDFVIADETYRAQLTQVTRTRPTGDNLSSGQYLKVTIVMIPE